MTTATTETNSRHVGYLLTRTTSAGEWAMTASYSSFGGRDGVTGTNCFGELCLRDDERRVQVWKTQAAAERNRSGEYRTVRAVHLNDRQLRELVAERIRKDSDALRAAVNVVCDPVE